MTAFLSPAARIPISESYTSFGASWLLRWLWTNSSPLKVVRNRLWEWLWTWLTLPHVPCFSLPPHPPQVKWIYIFRNLSGTPNFNVILFISVKWFANSQSCLLKPCSCLKSVLPVFDPISKWWFFIYDIIAIFMPTLWCHALIVTSLQGQVGGESGT